MRSDRSSVSDVAFRAFTRFCERLERLGLKVKSWEEHKHDFEKIAERMVGRKDGDIAPEPFIDVVFDSRPANKQRLITTGHIQRDFDKYVHKYEALVRSETMAAEQFVRDSKFYNLVVGMEADKRGVPVSELVDDPERAWPDWWRAINTNDPKVKAIYERSAAAVLSSPEFRSVKERLKSVNDRS